MKIVAIDLDGTLLHSDCTISSYSKEVIAEAGKNGIMVVPTSGRSFRSIKTRLHKNYIYLLLPYGEFFLWLTLIIFWRIPFSFQQKSLICYLLSKPDSR